MKTLGKVKCPFCGAEWLEGFNDEEINRDCMLFNCPRCGEMFKYNQIKTGGEENNE